MPSPKKKDGFEGQKAIGIPAKIITRHVESKPVMAPLFITDIGYYPKAEFHHRQRPNGAKQHIFIYCISGNGSLKIGNECFLIGTGDIVLIPANTAHEYMADENNAWTIYWIHFKGSTSKDYINMMLQKSGSYVWNIQFQESRIHLFNEMYSSLEKGYSFDNLAYANLCLHYFLASNIFDNNYNHSTKKEKNDIIEIAIQYMRENLHKALSLQEIAAVVNLSPSYFGLLFKRKTGFTIIEYLNQLKTQKACQYLSFTELRINEIAFELGIEDP